MAKVKLVTRDGLDAFEAISALQKFLRRGMEREAGEMAFQVAETSKPFFEWVCRRLLTCVHEDCGDPLTILVVDACIRAARELYPNFRLPIANAILAICRAPKTREADHFQGVCWYPQLLGKIPQVPDWTRDYHTAAGKHRGIDYFRTVSAQLHPRAPKPDPYEDEFYQYYTEVKKRGLPVGPSNTGNGNGNSSSTDDQMTLF